ncbi:hypothetical protein FGO68_gene8301 [Halteria grandinella]|uniref:Uncharacterized protein n=1 Tax=Halteria grandinella TaxID=5974 RepID=A0A8J8NB73_HALGN|nr:hypothetical protein FGO68_gene8301 [Halteria grandinella]
MNTFLMQRVFQQTIFTFKSLFKVLQYTIPLSVLEPSWALISKDYGFIGNLRVHLGLSFFLSLKECKYIQYSKSVPKQKQQARVHSLFRWISYF